MFEIFNKSGMDLGPLESLIHEFAPFAQKRHGFQHPPKLFLLGDDENAANPLGKTGGYNPDSMEVTVYVSGRHPKDVLRSLSHELVHHNQNERGDLSDVLNTALGYAQDDPHMREMEREAYEQGNLCFRDWEDERKKQLQESIYYETIIGGNDMSEQKPLKEWKDNEINTRLMKKFGLLKEEGTAGDDVVINDKDATKEKGNGKEEDEGDEDGEDDSIGGLEEKSVNDTLSRLNEEAAQLLSEKSGLGYLWDWATQGYREDPVAKAMASMGRNHGLASGRPSGETRRKEYQYFTRPSPAGGEDIVAPQAAFDAGGSLVPGIQAKTGHKDIPIYEPAGERARVEMGVLPRSRASEAAGGDIETAKDLGWWYSQGERGGWMDPSGPVFADTGWGEESNLHGDKWGGPTAYFDPNRFKGHEFLTGDEYEKAGVEELDRDLMTTAELMSMALPIGPGGAGKVGRFNPNLKNVRQFGKARPVKPPHMSQRAWERLLKQKPDIAAQSPWGQMRSGRLGRDMAHVPSSIRRLRPVHPGPVARGVDAVQAPDQARDVIQLPHTSTRRLKNYMKKYPEGSPSMVDRFGETVTVAGDQYFPGFSRKGLLQVATPEEKIQLARAMETLDSPLSSEASRLRAHGFLDDFAKGSSDVNSPQYYNPETGEGFLSALARIQSRSRSARGKGVGMRGYDPRTGEMYRTPHASRSAAAALWGSPRAQMPLPWKSPEGIPRSLPLGWVLPTAAAGGAAWLNPGETGIGLPQPGRDRGAKDLGFFDAAGRYISGVAGARAEQLEVGPGITQAVPRFPWKEGFGVPPQGTPGAEMWYPGMPNQESGLAPGIVEFPFKGGASSPAANIEYGVDEKGNLTTDPKKMVGGVETRDFPTYWLPTAHRSSDAEARRYRKRARVRRPAPKRDDLLERAPYIWDDLNESLGLDEEFYDTLFEGIQDMWEKESKE